MKPDALVLKRSLPVFVDGQPVFLKRGDRLPPGVSDAELCRLVGAGAVVPAGVRVGKCQTRIHAYPSRAAKRVKW